MLKTMELLNAKCNPCSSHPCTNEPQRKKVNHKQLLPQGFRRTAVMQDDTNKRMCTVKIQASAGTTHMNTDNNVTDLEEMSYGMNN